MGRSWYVMYNRDHRISFSAASSFHIPEYLALVSKQVHKQAPKLDQDATAVNETAYLRPVKRFFSTPYWALRERLARFPAWFGDAAKAFVMLLILRPAADWLPRRWAFALARACGRIHAAMPFYGRRKYDVVKRTLRNDPKKARLLTAAILSRHFIDFVMFRRYLRGRENIEELPVVESNVQIVAELRRSSTPYIVITGHFSRYTVMPLYLSRIIPQRIISIVNAPVPKSLHPQKIWLRAHFGQMLAFLARVRPDMQFLFPGNSDLFKKLIRGMKQPDNTLVVAVDAPWDKQRPGSIIRAFAGRKSAGFATGAARLSRMTQCPMVLCIPHLNDHGQINLDWIRLIEPPDPKDANADIVNTNLLLDDIEHAIGLYPDQYVIDVFGQRTWDCETQRWQ